MSAARKTIARMISLFPTFGASTSDAQTQILAMEEAASDCPTEAIESACTAFMRGTTLSNWDAKARPTVPQFAIECRAQRDRWRYQGPELEARPELKRLPPPSDEWLLEYQRLMARALKSPEWREQNPLPDDHPPSATALAQAARGHRDRREK